ncbi:MAG TPA: DoxX family protein [Vicinamibacterales bacterium]
MTTLFATYSPAATVPSVSRSRAGTIALWTTQLLVAGMFLLAGGLKLTGAPVEVALFDAIGAGQWFRYVTGSIEVAGALALLVPSLAPFGALLLIPTMIGAIATHLFIIGGTPAPAMLLLIGSITIAWARRRQLAGILNVVR